MNNEAMYKQCYEDSLCSLGLSPYFIDRYFFFYFEGNFWMKCQESIE